MRSPALAIGWAFGRRHRWGFIALVVYMLALVVFKLIIGLDSRVYFENDESLWLVVLVPLTATFMYFLAIFSFGLDGDIAGRQSMYPPRMFTLPVTTAALVGWPMLYGSAAMAILWLGTRFLAPWPAHFPDLPVVWPALLAPSLLAWLQALVWMPYPLPGMRVTVSILLMTSLDAIVMIALEYKAPEGVMLAILAPHVPVAFLVAHFAVGKARRGDVPDWGRLFTRFGNSAGRLTKRFSSAARAQFWLEWRQHGRSLPWLVAILVPCELLLLFAFSETPVIIFEVLVIALLTPPFMAIFVAATVAKPNTAFVATRPLNDVSLVAAKLRATIVSTLVTWLLVLIAIPIALRLSGTSATVMEWLRGVVEVWGMPRAIVIALLAFFALLASTWKLLVQSLYIGMSGREWLIKASVFGALTFITIAFPLAIWYLRTRGSGMIVDLINTLPWIFAVLACLKLSAALWIAMRLHDSRLVSARKLVMTAISWDVTVFVLFGLLLWSLPTMIVRPYFLALVAILAVPLVRVSVAPLALAWSRHR